MTTDETIPACPDCRGEGCSTCLGTGLTVEDCDFSGLARALSGGGDQDRGPAPSGIQEDSGTIPHAGDQTATTLRHGFSLPASLRRTA